MSIVMSKKYLIFLCFINVFFISCATTRFESMEELENELKEKGYTEFTFGESKAENEALNLLLNDKEFLDDFLPYKSNEDIFTLVKSKIRYQNFTVETSYKFIGFDKEMINKYVLIRFWGINKNGDYVCKGYEKENTHNKKGERHQLQISLEDKNGKIIEKPVLYIWE